MDPVVAVVVKVALRMWGAGSWDSLADWMGVRRGLDFLVVAFWKKQPGCKPVAEREAGSGESPGFREHRP